MTRRKILFGILLLVGALGMAYLGAYFAVPTVEAKPKADAKPMPTLRAGYVAMSEVLGGSKKWQDLSKKSTTQRNAAAKKMGVLQAAHQQLQQQVQAAPPEDQIKLAADLRDMSRKIEDTERNLREELEHVAKLALSEMQVEFNKEIEALARERQLDVIYGHPVHFEKMFATMGKTQQTMELYFRPQAMQPIYMRAEMDLTQDLIDRLNAAYNPAADKDD